MLQWMGGSRRKVTTSRKSTEKRQKQYFEQRKRQQQQQQTAFPENNADNLATCDHLKGNRSLDILSLLNVSKFAEESNSLPVVDTASKLTNKVIRASCAKDVDSSLEKNDEGHAYSASYHTSTNTPIKQTSEITSTECTVPTETRASSLDQKGRIPSKSCRGNPLYGKSMESEHLKSASTVQPSIFDLVCDDEAIGNSEEPSKEAHVAFSIEGLGTVGTETPMQSPQRPESKLNGNHSALSKAAKNFKSVNNNALPDDLAMEVECLMHNVERPSRCHEARDLTRDQLHPLTSFEHEMPTFKDDIKLCGKKCKMKSLYYDDRHDDFFDASSSCFDGYEVDDIFGVKLTKSDGTNSSYYGKNNSSHKKSGVNLEKRDGIINPYIGSNDSSDFNCKRFHTSMRKQEEIFDDDCSYLDGDWRFTVFDEPKYSSLYNDQALNYSPFAKLEDMQNNLTSFSGNYCSSTAVGGVSTAYVPYARIRKRNVEDLDVPLEVNTEDDNDYGMWNRMSNTSRRGDQSYMSTKHIRSGSSHSRPAFLSGTTGNEHKSFRLFEEEFPVQKISSNPESFFAPSENTPHQKEDSYGLDREFDYFDFRNSNYFSQRDVPNDFSSGYFGYHPPFCSSQPCESSFISEAMYEESSLGVHNFKVHVQTSNSAEVSKGNESTFPATELSAQGSVTEEVGDQTKSRAPEKFVQFSAEKKYSTPKSNLPSQETIVKDHGESCDVSDNCGSQEVSKHGLEEDAEETSFNNFTPNPDDELNTPPKESKGIIQALSRQEVKVCADDHDSLAGKDMVADNLKGPEPKTTMMDSCCQLMMVERYVLKLVSVPNTKLLSGML